MKFGKIDNPENIHFSLPADDPATARVLGNKKKASPSVYVGCAKWNKTDLKNFYPRGTKDELTYYASQFNSIEVNSTFYSNFGEQIISSWREKTVDDFRFFPKLNQSISHWSRLKNAEESTQVFLDGIAHLEHKLGMLFLQLPDNFGPKNWEALEGYLENWPSGFPLGLELRHPGWYDGSWENGPLYDLLEQKSIAHLITDTVGRRDLLHMRLTTPVAFIRYNGANVVSDYSRLDEWVERLNSWVGLGLENIYFFVHQNHEEASPLLSAYFIEKINKSLGTTLKVPLTQNPTIQGSVPF